MLILWSFLLMLILCSCLMMLLLIGVNDVDAMM
jgi:hypothetical protein